MVIDTQIGPVPNGRVPTVGFVGAGQLARMTIPAAIALSVPLRLLAEHPNDAAAIVSPQVDLGPADDADALARFAATCDVLTFDHEIVNTDALSALERAGHTIRPSAATLALVQDKLAQRQRLERATFPVPAFESVDDARTVTRFADAHGWPVVVKSVRGGYDGRGVWVLNDAREADRLLRETQSAGIKLLVERHIRIRREIAVQVARRPNGEMATYAVVETVQVAGICRELIVPAPISPDIAVEAERIATSIATAFDVVGLLAVELFIETDPNDASERLIVNELASRPHNSAHWTIEGSRTSQFAQHLRAVLDWPLGATDRMAPAIATVNILGGLDASGDPAVRVPEVLRDPGVHVHLYGKVARPGRKLGHVTVLGEDVDDVLERARQAASILTGEPVPAVRG